MSISVFAAIAGNRTVGQAFLPDSAVGDAESGRSPANKIDSQTGFDLWLEGDV
jgi:hypothetical protein